MKVNNGQNVTRKTKTSGKTDQSQNQIPPRKPTIKVDKNAALANIDTLKNVQFDQEAQSSKDDPALGYVPLHMLAHKNEQSADGAWL